MLFFLFIFTYFFFPFQSCEWKANLIHLMKGNLPARIIHVSHLFCIYLFYSFSEIFIASHEWKGSRLLKEIFYAFILMCWLISACTHSYSWRFKEESWMNFWVLASIDWILDMYKFFMASTWWSSGKHEKYIFSHMVAIKTWMLCSHWG